LARLLAKFLLYGTPTGEDVLSDFGKPIVVVFALNNAGERYAVNRSKCIPACCYVSIDTAVPSFGRGDEGVATPLLPERVTHELLKRVLPMGVLSRSRAAERIR